MGLDISTVQHQVGPGTAESAILALSIAAASGGDPRLDDLRIGGRGGSFTNGQLLSIVHLGVVELLE